MTSGFDTSSRYLHHEAERCRLGKGNLVGELWCSGHWATDDVA